MADYPQNFIYNNNTQTLSWDGVIGDIEYQVDYKLNDGISPWQTAYLGISLSCSFLHQAGAYSVNGRGKKGGTGIWSDWSPEEIIIVG